MAFASSLLDHIVVPRTGFIAVRRDKVPDILGGVVMPERYRKGVKKPVGLVIASASKKFVVGDVVLCGVGIVLHMTFGWPDGTDIYLAHEDNIDGKLLSKNALEMEVEFGEQDPNGRWPMPQEFFLIRDDASDEGRRIPPDRREDKGVSL